MSAQILSFPDRRGNRPLPILPPTDVVEKVRAYSWKLGLNGFNRHAVMHAVEHWHREGYDDRTVASRGMALANRLACSHKPDPNGGAAA